METQTGLEEGITQFNAGDFFACHDTLEDVWMWLRGPDRSFFQGLIQVSVGYYHLSCENYPGAEHLLERGIQKLQLFPAQHRGVDIEDLLRQALQALVRVVEVREGKRETYTLEILPKIQIRD